MSCISSEEETFDWKKYLMLRNAEEVPESFFFHICKSEMNGIELGSIIEVENEDHSGYWYASVCSSTGVLIRLHYLGDENGNHDFWLEVRSSRIHPINWGSKNNKIQSPPHTDRFSRVNLKLIQEKVKNCEHIVSNAVLQMKGAPIYNIFKPEMFVEIQDIDYPYHVWISKVIKNVGGRLLLQTHGTLGSNEPFWLFYLNKRVFPLGWADQKGLPWRSMNSNNDIKNNNNNSSLLLNVLKPKTPEQHSYKVGEMLEVLNPYSLMVFHVATIVRTYNNHYFKVEVDNEYDINKRLTFWATKENPYLFKAGWASKHKFLLKPPSDWDKLYTFSWSEYISTKNSKLAIVDNKPTKKNDNVRVGMKLEAVDPIKPDRIRVATIKGFADHWMFLTFDRTSWCQELLHIRSIYSDDVFPVGWCNKHKYQLSVPRLPYTNCNDFDHCYYVSDVDIEFNKLDNVAKYSQYIQGEIAHHYSEKGHKTFDDNLEESLQNVINDDNVQHSNVSSLVNNEVQEVIEPNVKIESSELDEEFHNALLSEHVDGIKEFENDGKTKFNENNSKSEFEKDNVIMKTKDISPKPLKTFNTYSYRIRIYFNKDCYTGGNFLRRKISLLPNNIGPGPISKTLQEALTIFVSLDSSPCNLLKKIKQTQHMLFNGPGGVKMLVSTMDSYTKKKYSEFLFLPESKMMAKTYCSALCNLCGMCEYFMSTEKKECPRLCSDKYITKLISKLEKKSSHKATKRNVNSKIFKKSNKSTKKETLYEIISKCAKKKLDWSNKALVERYKYYLACILNYEAHVKKLRDNFTETELVIIKEIQIKKWDLRRLDEISVLDCTKTESYNENKFSFADNWKYSFQNYYKKQPKYKKFKIDIGYIENIQVMSNPIDWSPSSVYKYLSNDPDCKQIAKKLLTRKVDGVALMLLKERNLIDHLGCDLSLMIRMMCHLAEVKYTYLKYYDTPDPPQQINHSVVAHDILKK